MAVWSKRVFPQVALHHCSISGASTIQTHWHMLHEPLSSTMQTWWAVTATQTTESRNHHPTHTGWDIPSKKKMTLISIQAVENEALVGQMEQWYLHRGLPSNISNLPAPVRCTYVICNKSAAKYSNWSWQIKPFWHPHFSLCALRALAEQ